MSTASIDQHFVEFVVKSLVGNPDAVQIVRTIDEKGVLLELTVDPEDLGRVIGKRGATAQSIRTLLRALGTKNDARYNLKIVDNSPEGHVRAQREDDKPATKDDSFRSELPTKKVTKDDEDDDLVLDNDDASSMASKTRKELEDLDDLDV